jgi:ATP-dependent Clp protease ATP-binding subunit ClpB
VLDDGRLTDGQGRTVDFKNTLIIMTSNIGSHLIRESFAAKGRDHEKMEEAVRAELKKHFRPEFINRVDDIIIFHSLNEKQLAAIVEIQLQSLRERLARQQLSLEVDPAAMRLVAAEGYDPQFGARPLKRAIQHLLLDPLALKLLEGEFKPGDRIKSNVVDGHIQFEKQK